MKRIRLAAAMVLTTVLLSACGKVTSLRPAAGQTLPPAPFGAAQRPTADVLLTPTAQQRPGVIDSLLNQSELRQPDPFDLAPGAPAAPLAQPTPPTLPPSAAPDTPETPPPETPVDDRPVPQPN